jgi:hypothetical protein
MYFDHVAKKIKEFNNDISLKFKEVAKLKTLEKSSTDVPKLAIFDYDLNKIEFENNVKMCKNTRILYSNLNFDLWLVLHKQQFRKSVQSNDAYVNTIRNKYNLVSNADIKTKANMEKILEQIELSDIKKAVENAEEIMNGKLEEDKIYVKKDFSYYPNPSMSINVFFKNLFKELNI